MTTAKHTQGPWRAGSGTGGKGSVVSDHLAAGALGGSGDFAYYGGNLIAESIAQENIPLIAAAPELLAALKKLQSLLFLRTDANDSEAMNAMQESRAAIAKATGSAA